MGVNFNEFINQYRLKHFKSIALNPDFKHITILGLAYDSGFNSKSVFNTFFKKVKALLQVNGFSYIPNKPLLSIFLFPINSERSKL